METPSPLDVVAQLVNAMNTGDVEGALSLFDPEALFVVQPGVVVSGTSATRQALDRGAAACASGRCRAVLCLPESARN